MVLRPASSWLRSLPTGKLSGSGTTRRSNPRLRRSVTTETQRHRGTSVSLWWLPVLWYGFLVAPQVFDVLVIFLARISHDPVGLFAPGECSRDGPWLRKENGIVVGDRPLDVIVVDFLHPLRQMQYLAVFVSCRVEPAPFVDSHCIDHKRVAF